MDPSGRRIIYTDEIIKEGWEICWSCEAHRPHRAYHCIDCRICILKRDHHSIIAANCVGYNNARYYYTFLLWTLIGATLCNIINIDFLVKLATRSSLKTVISFFAPMIAWAFGIVDEDFYAAILAMAALLTLIVVLYHAKISMDLVSKGLSWEEYERKIEANRSFHQSMEDTFGKNWRIGKATIDTSNAPSYSIFVALLAWLSPLLPSKLLSDGTHYTL